MYKPTINGIVKHALHSGLKMYGIPNSSRRYKSVFEEIGTDIDKYEHVIGSGLIWDDHYSINRCTASERIKQELGDALDNFLYIGDFEYVFFPISQKDGLDCGSRRLLMNTNLREDDGKIYTVCGESSSINIITVDLDMVSALVLYQKIAEEQEGYGWCSNEEMNWIMKDAINDNASLI